MIDVIVVVNKAKEKNSDECKDNDDVSISMMKIMMMRYPSPPMMMMIMVAAPVTTAWQAPFVTTVPLNTYKSINDNKICYIVCGYDIVFGYDNSYKHTYIHTFLPYLIFLR